MDEVVFGLVVKSHKRRIKKVKLPSFDGLRHTNGVFRIAGGHGF